MMSEKFESFARSVDEELLKGYGISWKDASGDSDLLVQAFQGGETPEEFVQWFAQKYDLTPVDSLGL